MLDKVIIFKNDDGTIGIVTPEEKTLLTMSIEDIARKDVPQGKSYRITDVTNLPDNRAFRNAWTDDNFTDTVDIDMPKARQIKMKEIRQLRDKKLPELDLEYMLADERSDSQEKSYVATRKQSLRDLPVNVDLDSISTPQELKNFIPTELRN